MPLLAIVLLACAGPGEESEPKSVSYAAHAAPTLRTHCTACHGALRAEGGLRLDSASVASQAGSRALVRMEEGSMPPGGGVSSAEIQAFSDWLDAGAPGPEVEIPGAEALPNGVLAVELEVYVQERSPGRFELFWAEPWSTVATVSEVWLLQGDALFLEQRTWGEQTDTWAPPLRLFDAAQDSWTQDTERERVDPSGTVRWTEQWQGERWDTLDARSFDSQAVGSRIQELGGSEMGFQSGTRFVVARRSAGPDEVDFDSMLVRSEALPSALLEDGLTWTERVILWD